jgi:hypothetical protein
MFRGHAAERTPEDVICEGDCFDVYSEHALSVDRRRMVRQEGIEFIYTTGCFGGGFHLEGYFFTFIGHLLKDIDRVLEGGIVISHNISDIFIRA